MSLSFIHITDSHFGVSEEQYNKHNFHLQEGHPEQMDELIAALSDYVKKEKVDFVLHTGDMINAYSVEHISEARDLFTALPVPVYLCLGNHDMWHVDGAANAKSDWLRLAPDFFPPQDGKSDVNFTLKYDEARIHILPNQWGTDIYEWTDNQTTSFLKEQQQFIEKALGEATDKIHIIATHAPVQALDAGQVGPGMGRHAPDQSFTDYFDVLKQRNPHLRVVIGGHTHHNLYVASNDCHYITTSSFAEAPFDCKLFTIDDRNIEMHAHSLGHDVEFKWNYNFNATHAQERLWDRCFEDRNGEYMKATD